MTDRTTNLSATFAHLKRASLTIAFIGILGISLAACDQANPTPPSPSPSPTSASQIAVEATATPVALVATATPIDSVDPATPTPVEESVASPTPPLVSEATPESTAQPAACALLNLNTVTEAELMATIPGFSSRMVREFFEYRPYVSIQQFRREIGKYVDQNQVAEYEQYVYVPVQPNDSDAETLKQVPGVDDNVAATLISGRPYASNDAFLAALATQVTGVQTAEAACYLDANP